MSAVDTMDLELGFMLSPDDGVDPVELPEWLTDDEPQEGDEPVRGRHAKRYCPWVDVVVPPPTSSPAVEAAATTAMLDLQVGFIKSPTAKHAHDGTALALLAFAAAEIRTALARRSVPRRRLRSLLAKLEAMD